jgi:Flp pilus assembly protein TadG
VRLKGSAPLQLPRRLALSPSPRGGRSQTGSVVVLVAGGLVTLLVMTAFIFAAGSSFWARRQMQELADTAALSGSLSITTICNPAVANAVITASHNSLVNQLGGGSGVISDTGGCVYVGNFTYPAGVSSRVTYPYNHDLTKIEVVVQKTAYFSLSSLLGTSSAPIQARAVARFLGGVASGWFGVFASNTIDCMSATPTVIGGSIYAVNGIVGSGSCRTRAIKDPSYSGLYKDFGNMLVWADGQAWSCPTLSCADGYQAGGHTAASCGVTGTTQYLDAAQTPYNPSPCVGGAVTRYSYPSLFDPNTSLPNPPAGLYQPTMSAALCDKPPLPPTPDLYGFVHYQPGCFSTLDLTAVAKVALDPGFYYFGVNGGQGLCLGGVSRLIGSDVTLEFVGNASLSSVACDLSGSCAVACGFGTDPSAGPADGPLSQATLTPPGSTSAWCTAACPSKGILVYYANAAGTGTGQLLVKGSGQTSWMQGTVFWQNARCEWWGNGTSSLSGQLLCKDVHLGGTPAGPAAAVATAIDLANLGVPEASLIE